MATIVTRAGKGSPLTNAEVDANFTNLNTELGAALARTGGTMTGAITFAAGQTWPTFNQSTTGSAATLTTGRTIALTGDVTYTSGSFNGSANVTGTATLAASGVTAGTYTKVTVDAKGRVTTGAALAAGDVPTLNQSTTGNAATATTLQTARTINGVSFDGSANITVADATKLPLSGGTLTGSVGFGDDATRGPILTFGAITGGAAYVDGTYTGVALTGGSGSLATANITVAGGAVTAVTLVREGARYIANDSLSATAATLGGTGSGFSVVVATVRLATLNVFSSSPRLRLMNSSTGVSAGTELGSVLFGSNDASAGGRGDKVRITALAEGTSGGGSFNIFTAINAGEPGLALTLTGANALRLYNSTSTFYVQMSNSATANRTLTVPDETGTLALTSSSITGNAATATILQTARTINGVSFNGSANITVADATKLPLAGGALTGTLSTTAGVNLTRDGATADPYAPLSVTRGTASNFAYASFTRAGNVAWQMGINTGNSLIIGSGSAGIDGVISSVRLTLDTASNLTAAGNVTAYSDERLKKDWADLPSDFIERLAVVKRGTYTRIDTGERQIGVSAQAVQQFAPEGVLSGEYLAVAYGNVALVSAVELAKRLIAAEKEIAVLKEIVRGPG